MAALLHARLKELREHLPQDRRLNDCGVAREARFLTDGDTSVAVFPFTPTPEASNSHGSTHAGNITWLFVTLGSVHLLAVHPVLKDVSVVLSTNFIAPVMPGKQYELRSKVVRFGNKLAFLEATVVDVVTGATCATASHTKAIIPASARL
jgi:acyl-coenzyme A thioesterase PaaI-like protein